MARFSCIIACALALLAPASLEAAPELWHAPGSGPARMLNSQSMHKPLVAMLVGPALAEGTFESQDDPLIRGVEEPTPTSDFLSGLAEIDGPFEPDAVPTPDYDDPRYWAAHPDRNDPADGVPAGLEAGGEKQAVAFYIHPTTYRSAGAWNADPFDPIVARETARVIAGQASTFNGCCDVYAPHYRQAHLTALGNPEIGAQIFDLAYQDVLRAFDHFLHETGERPIILAGHSQGGFHLRRLLQERGEDLALRDRLVAAYIVGIGVGLDPAITGGVPACTAARQTDCRLSWNAFDAGADASAWRARSRSSLPNGETALQCDNLLADAPMQSVALVLDGVDAGQGRLIPLAEGARCEEGVLMLNQPLPKELAPLALPGGSLHLADFALVYAPLRADAMARAERFIAQ